VIYRKDYAPPPYLIDTVDLAFNLNEGATTVTAKLAMTPNYGAASGAAPPPLVLNGRKDVKLVSLKVAGAPVAADAYEVADKTLTLKAPPAGAYELEVGAFFACMGVRACVFFARMRACSCLVALLHAPHASPPPTPTASPLLSPSYQNQKQRS
jgi:hypothetical protein